MAVEKRNRFKLWAVTVGYLIAYRIVLTLTAGFAGVVYLASLGIHGKVSKEQVAAQLGNSALWLGTVMVALTWGGRIVIVMLARAGKLPGTRIPPAPAEIATVFADAPAIPAQRAALAAAYAYAPPEPQREPLIEPQGAPAVRKGFGARDPGRVPPPVHTIRPVVAARADVPAIAPALTEPGTFEPSTEETASQRIRRLRAA